MENNIGSSFDKLISKFYFKYRGCFIERKNGGYQWGRVHYDTIEDLDEAITKGYGRLGESINKIK